VSVVKLFLSFQAGVFLVVKITLRPAQITFSINRLPSKIKKYDRRKTD